MDAAAFRANLDGIGISFSNYGYDRVCNRTEIVRATLERELGKPCDLITREELQAINPINESSRAPYFALNLAQAGLTELRFGDFTGLHHLKTLVLSGNLLTLLSGENFAGLNSLDSLHLTGNRLTEVPRGLLDRLPQLKTLALNSNRIRSIPPGFLRNSFNLDTLDLSFNEIQELPADLFNGRRQGRLVISFNNNQLTSLPDGILDSLPDLPDGATASLHEITIQLDNNPFSPEARRRIQQLAERKPVRIYF